MSLVTVAPLGPMTLPSASEGIVKDRILGIVGFKGRGRGADTLDSGVNGR